MFKKIIIKLKAVAKRLSYGEKGYDGKNDGNDEKGLQETWNRTLST